MLRGKENPEKCLQTTIIGPTSIQKPVGGITGLTRKHFRKPLGEAEQNGAFLIITIKKKYYTMLSVCVQLRVNLR